MVNKHSGQSSNNSSLIIIALIAGMAAFFVTSLYLRISADETETMPELLVKKDKGSPAPIEKVKGDNAVKPAMNELRKEESVKEKKNISKESPPQEEKKDGTKDPVSNEKDGTEDELIGIVEAVDKAGDLHTFCEKTFTKSKKCPQEVCMFNCYGGIVYEGCKQSCYPKSCIEIDAENCPQTDCQVLKGCSDIDRCFNKIEYIPECGEIAYEGQDAECCEGLVKRCGLEFYDGSCDMIAEKSVYGVPVCLPCGNGTCNQFENRCNCPEDCS